MDDWLLIHHLSSDQFNSIPAQYSVLMTAQASSTTQQPITNTGQFISVDELTSQFHSTTLHNDNSSSTPTPLTIQRLAELIHSKQVNNIIVMTGAGISTSCGIPDFRSPDTGLYSNLQRYDLPHPEAIFDISYFKQQPQPFYRLMCELLPKNKRYVPSYTHFFIHKLQESNQLKRLYTQNIDGLEYNCSMRHELVIQAHGGYSTSSCIQCRKQYDQKFVEENIHGVRTSNDTSQSSNSGADDVIVNIPYCTSNNCNGIVKPDITFFGEGLPRRFFQHIHSDFNQCDLLIVAGTSLVVQPFASLINRVGDNVPRVLVNREPAGEREMDHIDIQYNKLQHQLQLLLKSNGEPRDVQAHEKQIHHLLHQIQLQRDDNKDGFDFTHAAHRDLFLQGECDEQFTKLAKLLNWHDDIINAIQQYKLNNNTMPTTEELVKNSIQSGSVIATDNESNTSTTTTAAAAAATTTAAV